MENDFLSNLLLRVTDGTATDEELLLYQKWYDQQLLRNLNPADLESAKQGVSKEIYNRLKPILDQTDFSDGESVSEFSKSDSVWKIWLSVAAAVVIMFTVGIFYLKNDKPIQIIQKEYKNVDFDTTEGVILKLASGENVNLTSISNTEINQLTDQNVSKYEDKIQYNLSAVNQNVSKGSSLEEVYNTLYTPAGKTFQIVLSDGTKVWLNAKSMLRFPVNFNGLERRVQLIGEGYFEVSSNKAKSFVVESLGQELKVHGTKFNVNAYSDVSFVKSTLFEGSVSIKNMSTDESVYLLPGEQSVNSSKSLIKNRVLLKSILGWKNGYFVFHNEKFINISNSLSRWYNIEFDYSKNEQIKNQVFSGTVVKFENVEDVLSVLSETGTIKFELEGRRIILMN